jgi:hypothetical protein
LSKSPINNESQESLEKYLLDYTYISIDNDNISNTNPLIDYSILNQKLAKILVDNRVNLIKIINNFRKAYKDKKLDKRSSQKEISCYYLNLLLTEVDNSELIAIMYGRLMRIITRYNRFYTNDVALDIFQDMCESLIRDYSFSLYNKHIIYLCKLDDNYNENDMDIKTINYLKSQKMKTYTLTD